MTRHLIGIAIASIALFVAVGRSHQPDPRRQPEAQTKERQPLERQFQQTIQPFLKTHCAACHGGEKPKGDFDLRRFAEFDAIVKDLRCWENVLEQIDTGSMPPARAKPQPSAEQRQEVIAWIRAVRAWEGKRNAGDPGPIPARRLSNAEYDYTIRDLTGVDIRPALEFPVDPANEAGFDNSAESLSLSPALLNKYLEGARKVSEHILFEAGGLRFAEYPVISDTDRDKFCVRQVIDFYRKQRTDYADYFQAAWRYRHRAVLGKPAATLADLAAADGISPKYLATIWSVLDGPADEIGPVGVLRMMWRNLPAADTDNKDQARIVRAGCERMRDLAVAMRDKLVPQIKNLTAPSMAGGSQALILWKNRQVVANRMRYVAGSTPLKLEDLAPDPAAARLLTAPPAGAALQRFHAALNRFCAVFPDAFFITERTRTDQDPRKEKEKNRTGRLLNAGFHSMTGYFRDDAPLHDLVLSQAEQRELDRLWLDLDVITGAPVRQYTSFLWYERSDSSFMRAPEFDLFRAEDKDSTSPAKIQQLAKVYLRKAINKGASETVQSAIKEHFEIIDANIRRMEKARKEAEPRHLEALQLLAERAYRRPLAKAERDSIAAFYRNLRDRDGLDHQEAVRDALVSILLSPRFLFVHHEARGKAAGKAVPLSDYALASRLSYFLWSSMPDAELLTEAAAGKLHRPEVLKSQVRRMVKDRRIRGLAVEFAGNWLDFRRFEEHNAVDRDRFKSFTDDLRRAMFEEPVRFFIDVVQNDRTVDDFLFGKHTFVNPLLARHYGMPEPSGPDVWVRIDDAGRFQRGGLLPMAVFQTKNAPGLRTSPVKRGYWVVRRLLGERIPAPPAQVPELPADEAKIDLPLREVLARHRADRSCAACHARFDAIGLAFEGYGPIGELRKLDLGGRPIDARASFPGGGDGTGLEGLQSYLRQRRHDDFQNHLVRQMLAYALGRTLLPSDDELIQNIRRRLAGNESRISVLLEAIVTSPQFVNRRGEV